MTAPRMDGPSGGETLALRVGRTLLAIRGCLAAITGILLLQYPEIRTPSGRVVAGFAVVMAGVAWYVAVTMHKRGGWRLVLASALLFLDIAVQTAALASAKMLWFTPLLLLADVATAMALSVRDMDRIRGGGFMLCPNCLEQAFQEVVDRVRFAGLFGYRLGIIHRRRDLACRRCQFRRPVRREELSTLNTAGLRIRRAWLPPVGLIGLVGGISVVYFGFILTPSVIATPEITYNTATLMTELGGPLQYDEPVAWNHDILDDGGTGPKYLDVHIERSDGRTDMKIRRLPGSISLTYLAVSHFQDEKSLQTGSYPSSLPKVDCSRVAGEPGATFSVRFAALGSPSKAIFFVFAHQNVGYVVEFAALQQGAVDRVDAFAQHSVASMKFIGSEGPQSGASSGLRSPAVSAPDVIASVASPPATGAVSPTATVHIRC